MCLGILYIYNAVSLCKFRSVIRLVYVFGSAVSVSRERYKSVVLYSFPNFRQRVQECESYVTPMSWLASCFSERCVSSMRLRGIALHLILTGF